MIRSIEKFSDLIGNLIRGLPACSIVPQPTTLPRVPIYILVLIYLFPLLGTPEVVVFVKCCISSTVSKCEHFRWFFMVRKRKKSHWARSGRKWVVAQLRLICSPKTPWYKALCVTARYCGGGSLFGQLFWPRTMNSLSQEFPELGYKTSGLQSEKLGNTVDGLYRCSPRTHQLHFYFCYRHLHFRGAGWD
jgi:hypothetical protein